jgi:imidazole glycerol-phosphate synthase subunit HisH
MKKEIILIDAGTGNLRSVQKALENVGATVTRTDDPQKVSSASKIVLPGVGAFGDFMLGLRAKRLDIAVKEAATRGIPLLGICVGMQALFDVGEEMGEHAGLGLLRGRVLRFAENLPVKIPHTGWNQFEARQGALLFNKMIDGAYVYFNHSYYCQAEDSSDIAAEVNYGLRYACSVQRGRIFGVQFHPEKSQVVGLQILQNFVEAK